MVQLPDPKGPARHPPFSETAWLDLLQAMDRTYADLVGYQERLERQNAELQGMRAFLTSILGSVSDVLIVVSRGGLVQQASASLMARTGRAAIEGGDLRELIDPADHARLQAGLAEARDSRRSVVLELGLLTPEGPSPLELSIAPRLEVRGRAAGFELTGRPLGELRLAYAELWASHDALKAAQAQLVLNEKLASLGRLLAVVAHELNNPISFVYANTHALDRYLTTSSFFPEKPTSSFSHTIKQQPHNRKLLRAVLDKNIRLIDHELLTDLHGDRVLAFGYWAGVVGAYNGMRGWQLIHGGPDLKPANQCHDLEELERYLNAYPLPQHLRIVLTGGGRVGKGAMGVLECAGVKRISPTEFLERSNTRPVYTVLGSSGLYRRDDGKPFDKQAFHTDPRGHHANFLPYARKAHIYMACHFWDPRRDPTPQKIPQAFSNFCTSCESAQYNSHPPIYTLRRGTE